MGIGRLPCAGHRTAAPPSASTSKRGAAPLAPIGSQYWPPCRRAGRARPPCPRRRPARRPVAAGQDELEALRERLAGASARPCALASMRSAARREVELDAGLDAALMPAPRRRRSRSPARVSPVNVPRQSRRCCRRPPAGRASSTRRTSAATSDASTRPAAGASTSGGPRRRRHHVGRTRARSSDQRQDTARGPRRRPRTSGTATGTARAASSSPPRSTASLDVRRRDAAHDRDAGAAQQVDGAVGDGSGYRRRPTRAASRRSCPRPPTSGRRIWRLQRSICASLSITR